jgi:hypothetical protein
MVISSLPLFWVMPERKFSLLAFDISLGTNKTKRKTKPAKGGEKT